MNAKRSAPTAAADATAASAADADASDGGCCSKRLRRAPEKAHWLTRLGVVLPDRELIIATDCGGGIGPPSALVELGVKCRHIFACESDPSSQQLLSSQAEPPERLFGSMIGRDRGCFCLVFGRWMPMPHEQPDIYISNAGVHGPNPDRFLAAVKYIMEHQPRLVILEDLVVAGREDQNGNLPADSILALLSQAGDYEVDTFHVTASHFGLPQRRQRLYYVMISSQHLQRGDKEPLEKISEALAQLRTVEPSVDAEDLLESLNFESQPSPKGSDKNVASLLGMSADASYLHRRLRHELRLPLDDMTYFQLAGAHLGRWLRTYREADVCQIHWLRAKSNKKEIRFVSVSQDAHRAAMSFTGEVPNLTPTTRLWSYRLQRVLGGREMLMLQGFKPDRWNLQNLSEASLTRVAGAAMTVHMIAAVLASALSCCHFPDAEHGPAPKRRPGRSRSISLAELRSRYLAIRQRLSGLRRFSPLGA